MGQPAKSELNESAFWHAMDVRPVMLLSSYEVFALRLGLGLTGAPTSAA